jgi:hypothetical protein
VKTSAHIATAEAQFDETLSSQSATSLTNGHNHKVAFLFF